MNKTLSHFTLLLLVGSALHAESFVIPQAPQEEKNEQQTEEAAVALKELIDTSSTLIERTAQLQKELVKKAAALAQTTPSTERLKKLQRECSKLKESMTKCLRTITPKN